MAGNRVVASSGLLERKVCDGRSAKANALQESFSLPLTFILIFFGCALIVVATGLSRIDRIRGPGN